MNCPNCITEISDDSKFCSECGTPVSSAGDVKPASNPPVPEALDAAQTIAPLSGPSAPTLDDGMTIAPPGQGVSSAGDRYEIVEKIGEGGMGVVFRARDTKLGRVVALKRLRANVASSAAAIQRFLTEAETIANLVHNHIVRVYDLGQDSQGDFIIMEFVDGEPLSARIKRDGALDEDEAVGLVRGLLSALKYAHEQGVLHRDVKPGNVLLTRDGEPKLVDFGLARMGEESQMTEIGTPMGTTAYASPEQLRDASSVDQRSDLYSLGATFYEMLSGESPLNFVEEKIPESLRAVVVKAMERDREQRWQNAAEFLDALTAASEGRGPRVGRRTAGKVVENGDCPRCGRRNGDEPRFCLDCGSNLYEPCLVCEKPTATGFQYCQKCGADQDAAAQKADEELTANVTVAQQDAAWGWRGDAFRAVEQAGQRQGLWIADVAPTAQEHLAGLEAACEGGDRQRQTLEAQLNGYQNSGDYEAVLNALRPLGKAVVAQWPGLTEPFGWASEVEGKVGELVDDVEKRLASRAAYKLLDPGPKALHGLYAQLQSNLDELRSLNAVQADRLSGELARFRQQDEERRDALVARANDLQGEGDYNGVVKELTSIPSFLIASTPDLADAFRWAHGVADRVESLVSAAGATLGAGGHERSAEASVMSPYDGLHALVEEVTSLDPSAGAQLMTEVGARCRDHLSRARKRRDKRDYTRAFWHVQRASELPGLSQEAAQLEQEMRAERRRRQLLVAGSLTATVITIVCAVSFLRWRAERLTRQRDGQAYKRLAEKARTLQSTVETTEGAVGSRIRAHRELADLYDEFHREYPENAHLAEVVAEKERWARERQPWVEAEYVRLMEAAQAAYRAFDFAKAAEHVELALLLKPGDQAARKLRLASVYVQPGPDMAAKAARGRLKMAQMLLKAGKTDKALLRLRDILDKYAGTPAARVARKELDKLQ